ncbi:unnamed protein product [Miscanthus lutarioriparius]|uniref:Uncharacterized protein n=1 Tax=Miscanthus lutarioriparius TaxID=422564 RepID=A0A811RWC4_9POAL|nr:unnamed protein product [Miscanthus lutarioriparius]
MDRKESCCRCRLPPLPDPAAPASGGGATAVSISALVPSGDDQEGAAAKRFLGFSDFGLQRRGALRGLVRQMQRCQEPTKDAGTEKVKSKVVYMLRTLSIKKAGSESSSAHHCQRRMSPKIDISDCIYPGTASRRTLVTGTTICHFGVVLPWSLELPSIRSERGEQQIKMEEV